MPDLPAKTRSLPARPLRSLILFSALALLALVVAVGLAAQALTSSFSQLEHSAIQQKSEQVYQAFGADLRQLFISNRDYAEWDDAEHFMQTREQAFIDGNFSPETLLGMNVDLVWIVDAAGKDVYSSLFGNAARRCLLMTSAPAIPALVTWTVSPWTS